MFSSAELIEALRGRARGTMRPDRPVGEFPPGWRDWFSALAARPGVVRGATATSIIELMMLREPAPAPGIAVELNRWQSFGTLWRQQWLPASADERWLRLLAIALTVLTHLLLAILLLWLAYVRLAAAPSADAGENVVQVEFIGQGTPAETSGAPPGDAATEPGAAARAGGEGDLPPVPAQPPVPAPTTAASQSAPAPTVVEIAPSPQPSPQPLQVTDVPVPDTSFVLAPPAPPVPAMPAPRIDAPRLALPAPTLEVTEVPIPVAPAVRPVPEPQLVAPRLRQRTVDIVARELPSPAPASPVVVPQGEAVAPDLRVEAPPIRTRDIPTPPTPPAEAARQSGAGVSAATAAAQADAAAGPARPAGAAASSTGTPSPPPKAPGSGMASATSPAGGPASPRRGDDWGASQRNRPGARAGRSTGLFDADGRPRLAPGTSAAPGGGLPPGTVEERIADIDRAGSWLRRKPTDYEPTRLDRYWVPNETLLAEWVRRSIKEVLIPIPGTSKKIRCSVALLALGGACGITDPNMLDIEATARQPPDVPFKPELQEDQQSLRRAP